MEESARLLSRKKGNKGGGRKRQKGSKTKKGRQGRRIKKEDMLEQGRG